MGAMKLSCVACHKDKDIIWGGDFYWCPKCHVKWEDPTDMQCHCGDTTDYPCPNCSERRRRELAEDKAQHDYEEAERMEVEDA